MQLVAHQVVVDILRAGGAWHGCCLDLGAAENKENRADIAPALRMGAAP